MVRIILLASWLLAPTAARAGDPAAAPMATENVVRQGGAWTLAEGPDVEGVFLLQQGAWPEPLVRAFHQTPWLDGASIRVPWSVLEPRDQAFDWTAADRVLAEVKRYNASHPAARRRFHVRVMGGRFCPKWFEGAGVRFYDTTHSIGRSRAAPLRIPVPYANPKYLEQLRQVYRAMRERYADEPLVVVYHGTWSAGPWDEIFHPQGDAPLPPDYTPAAFVCGMVEQLDVLIDEFCLKGLAAELPYSGKYPPKGKIDITGPLTARAVKRLGRRSPFLYIQSNGWGTTSRGVQTVSWGHERDLAEARGRVCLALQALGTNAGGGWLPQGNWVGLVDIAKKFDAAYIEIYPPDLIPLDTRHRIVQAFTQEEGAGGPDAVTDFIGYRPWLKARDRARYVREGTLRLRFAADGPARRLANVHCEAETPQPTSIRTRTRVRLPDGTLSPWADGANLRALPAGSEAEVEVTLYTDDGYATPRLRAVSPAWR